MLPPGTSTFVPLSHRFFSTRICIPLPFLHTRTRPGFLPSIPTSYIPTSPPPSTSTSTTTAWDNDKKTRRNVYRLSNSLSSAARGPRPRRDGLSDGPNFETQSPRVSVRRLRTEKPRASVGPRPRQHTSSWIAIYGLAAETLGTRRCDCLCRYVSLSAVSPMRA